MTPYDLPLTSHDLPLTSQDLPGFVQLRSLLLLLLFFLKISLLEMLIAVGNEHLKTLPEAQRTQGIY